MKCCMPGAPLFEEECPELNTVWYDFAEEYKDILDPAVVNLQLEHFHKYQKPPYVVYPSSINESAEDWIEDFRATREKGYRKQWKECFQLEKQVCTVCLLSKQLSLLKRVNKE